MCAVAMLYTRTIFSAVALTTDIQSIPLRLLDFRLVSQIEARILLGMEWNTLYVKTC